MQNELVWVEESAIRAIHEMQIREHGGAEGIRDERLLESAIARPKNHAAYADASVDVPALAAMVGVAIVGNHPFIDGNKRVGFVAMELFLRLNGFRFTADNASCVVQVLALAGGELSDAEFTDWVTRHAAR